MRYNKINNELFIKNRKNFKERLKPNSIAIFNSNDVVCYNADESRPFIQNTDLFYLTGIDQEDTCLIIFPDSREEDAKEILFIQDYDEKRIIWEGLKLNEKEASEISGIKTVYSLSQFNPIFTSLVFEAEHIYLNTNEHLRYVSPIETKDARFLKWCLQSFPLHKYERSAPIMHDIRIIKSPIEIELLKKAIDITKKAFFKVLNFVKPGVWEYEIEAEIYYEFLKNRSRRPAFEIIVASGKHSCYLHSITKNKQCNDGDVVLIDYGAEYANYSADITRTIPVNGKFNHRQKAVYNSVLKIHKEAIKLLLAGKIMDEYKAEVGEIVEKELIDLKLLSFSDVKKQDKNKPLYKKYFMHGISHHLGLDVHDLGSKYKKFEEGMVLTCEPGIYLPEENIGIRLENDMLITKNGNINLSSEIPIEIEEIEEIMNNSKTI
ncbi:MAG: aminopeptidase P N-terminal domain-containing protein [Desulfobacterales bacterium]|nr:aminopeptidase P N-terminal domain-containing protein [Desulfobacterales bacterium]